MDTLTSSELITGSLVMSQNNMHWSSGQIQSAIDNIVTVNFANVEKKVINIKEINVKLIQIK